MKLEDRLISLCSKKYVNGRDKNEIIKILGRHIDFNYVCSKFNSEFQVYVLNECLNEKRINDSLEIIRCLNKNNVNYVVLKGLTLKYFNRTRTFSDLDLFVYKGDVDNIISLLNGNFGYVVKNNELDSFKKNNFLTSSHEILLKSKSGNKVAVELHFSLIDYYFLDANALDVKKNKMFLKYDNVKVPCLFPELQLFSVILHCFHHIFCSNQYGRFIADINTLTENYNVDWNKFIDIICKFRCLEEVYRLIILLNKLSGSKLNIPLSVIKKMHKHSSKIRLFLTRNYENVEFLEKKSKGRFFGIKTALLFTVGFNKRFFKLLNSLIFKLVSNKIGSL